MQTFLHRVKLPVHSFEYQNVENITLITSIGSFKASIATDVLSQGTGSFTNSIAAYSKAIETTDFI